MTTSHDAGRVRKAFDDWRRAQPSGDERFPYDIAKDAFLAGAALTRPPAQAGAAEWPSDGTCRLCGSAPRSPSTGLCATCTDEAQAGVASVEVERLMHVIDRDRYAAAACLNAIDFVLHTRRWLREAGRGSYAYDDERYQQEFGLAFDEIMEAMRPMRALAKDKTDCATDPENVSAARTAGSERFAALSTPAASGEIPGGMVAWDMVSRLRDEEADSVTILCDNPDGPPNNAVECCGFWTGFVDKRFEGDTIIDALASAVAAKDHAASVGYTDPYTPKASAETDEPCGYCGVDPCRCDAIDLCQAPGCDNKTDRGICEDCNQWVSDQVSALSAAPSAPATEAGEGNSFRPMEAWDERDEAVLLLVDYQDGEHPLDDARFAITIGHNNDHNVCEDEGQGWRFAGWCWSHDHYVEGRGKPVGWMPMPHILARAYAAFDGQAFPATPAASGDGCICQGCGRLYRVDIMVGDDTWERIKPEGKAIGAGLLCGACIFHRIEALDRFDALHLTRTPAASGEIPGGMMDVRAIIDPLLAEAEPLLHAQVSLMKERACEAHRICYELMLAHPEISALGDEGILHRAIHSILAVDTPSAITTPKASAETGETARLVKTLGEYHRVMTTPFDPSKAFGADYDRTMTANARKLAAAIPQIIAALSATPAALGEIPAGMVRITRDQYPEIIQAARWMDDDNGTPHFEPGVGFIVDDPDGLTVPTRWVAHLAVIEKALAGLDHVNPHPMDEDTLAWLAREGKEPTLYESAVHCFVSGEHTPMTAMAESSEALWIASRFFNELFEGWGFDPAAGYSAIAAASAPATEAGEEA